MKSWEERNWSNKNGDTSNRHRKGFIRKLLTAPGDVSLHKPLAMAEKAAYLARYRNDGLCTWISSTCMYVAFDFVASHALPASTTRDLDRPEMLPFRKHPVSADLVSVRALLSGFPRASSMGWLVDEVMDAMDRQELRRLSVDGLMTVVRCVVSLLAC